MTSCQSGTFHVQLTTLWLNTVMWLLLVVSCFQWNFINGSVVGNFVKTSDSSGSSSTCAVVDSSVVSVHTRSVLHCAQVCTTETECVGFNSLPSSRTCDLFITTPTQFLPYSGCTFYGVNRSYCYENVYWTDFVGLWRSNDVCITFTFISLSLTILSYLVQYLLQLLNCLAKRPL